MNRLQAELHRLYLQPAPTGPDGGARGLTRVAVLELARPADWDALAQLWRGVQAELGLPAPAIAVSGSDGYQLWFSLATAVPDADALAFLEALRLRYLGGIAAERIRMLSTVEELLPPRQQREGQWSAFVAPDLAPVFAADPWLDTQPSADGQADLLLRLGSIEAEDFRKALARLGPSTPSAGASVQPRPAEGLTAAAHASVSAAAASDVAQSDARRFLLRVMNDDAVPLGLRIEAAKALLPGGADGCCCACRAREQGRAAR